MGFELDHRLEKNQNSIAENQREKFLSKFLKFKRIIFPVKVGKNQSFQKLSKFYIKCPETTIQKAHFALQATLR